MKKNQKGFTLIEIIAVLVILGILAAVAIPKYFDMQGDARNKALDGALAEGMSQMSMAYSKLMLSNSGTATTSDTATKASSDLPASDDFSYNFASTGIVTVTAKTGGSVGSGTRSKQWSKP